MPDPTRPAADPGDAEMTDRELDEKVARRVLGWQTRPHKYNGNYVEWFDPREFDFEASYRVTQLPRFSTEIAAAWMVLERLREHWGDVVLNAGLSWHCRTHNWKHGDPWGTADTAPRAICLAALQTFSPKEQHAQQ